MLERILLVEDDADLAEVIATVLRDAGYSVELAETVAQAQAWLTCSKFSLVIADWKLPDGDGTLIAEWGSALGSKTLVMSGYLPQMPGGRALGHPSLMKPFRANRLMEAIEDCLGSSQRELLPAGM